MKKMTCNQLGGACATEFHAETFDEIAQMSKLHVVEMMEKKDIAHLRAIQEMQLQMQEPQDMKDWFENKKREFEALPEDP